MELLRASGRQARRWKQSVLNICLNTVLNSVFILVLCLWIHEVVQISRAQEFTRFSQAEGPTLLWVDSLPLAINERKCQEAAQELSGRSFWVI